MGQKPDDNGALRGTQAAVCAGYVPTLGWADHYFPPGRGVDSVGGIRREHHYHGAAIDSRQFVGLAQCVRTEIDPEPVPVCESDAGTIAGSLRVIPDDGLVGVRPPSPPSLCADQLSQHAGVDIVADSRKIPSLIMAPQTAGGD